MAEAEEKMLTVIAGYRCWWRVLSEAYLHNAARLRIQLGGGTSAKRWASCKQLCAHFPDDTRVLTPAPGAAAGAGGDLQLEVVIEEQGIHGMRARAILHSIWGPSVELRP